MCRKQNFLEIKKDIGEQVIESLKKLLATIDAKKKEEIEKYSYPFCNKKLIYNH